MGKDNFKIELDFDLSKYSYSSENKRSFSIDDILTATSNADQPSERTKKTTEEVKLPVESDPITIKKEEPPEKPAVKEKRTIIPTPKKVEEVKPVVNTEAFDQIKSKAKVPSEPKVHNDEPKIEVKEVKETVTCVPPAQLQEDISEQQERDDILYGLKSLLCKITAKAVIMFVFLLAGLYLTVTRIAHLRFLLPAELDPTLNPKNYLISMLALSLVCLLFNISPLFDGLKKAFTGRLTSDGIALWLGVVCILGNTYFLLNTEKFLPLVITFDVMFIVLLLMNLMGKRLLVKHIIANFKMFSDERLKTIVSSPRGMAIDNDIMIETGNGGDVLYASKTINVADFMKKAFAEQNANRRTDVFYFIFYIIILVCGLTLWLFKAIELQKMVLLLSAIYAISSPVFSVWTHTLATYRLGRFLRSNSTMISGREGALKLTDCGVLVIRDTDILSNNDVSLHSMKVSEDYDNNDVIGYLAALFKSVDGPLNGFFERLSSEEITDKYPKLSDIYFHEQMGYTFKSNGKHFAVGTDEFMKQCSVEYPIMLSGEGVNVYISVDKKMIGAFSLSYHLSRRAIRALQILENESISVAILTTDFCLRESMFADYLYDPDMVTIISKDTAKNCMPLCAPTNEASAEIITYNSLYGLALGIYGCTTILSNYDKHGVYRITATLFGALIVVILSALTEMSFWLPFQILLYQFIWSLPNFLRGIKTK